MKIIRAAHLGMCFGVRDAIALAQEQSAGTPLTILGDLVHNETVLAELRGRGIRLENDLEKVATRTVMITAHGASEAKLARLRRQGLDVIEGTCPLVAHAHRSLKRLAALGYHPVVIGRRGHVEVTGLTEDFTECEIILSDADVSQVAERRAFGVVAQTTQPTERVHHLVALLRSRFPAAAVEFIDTVCQPTKQRQTAAVELAKESDAVVVIGGATSNNTRELVETCRRHCQRVFYVETADDLDPEWFREASTVGITAGTSTPDSVVDAVEGWLRRLGSS